MLRGQAPLFAPGDWLGLARALAEGPLARPPGARAEYDERVVAGYSSEAAAERLADAYAGLLAG